MLQAKNTQLFQVFPAKRMLVRKGQGGLCGSERRGGEARERDGGGSVPGNVWIGRSLVVIQCFVLL